VSAWSKLNIEEAIASIEIERGNRSGADSFCSKPQTIRTFEGSFTLSHWLILKRRASEAIPHLEFMRGRGEAREALPRLVDAYLLSALVAKARGEREEARSWLEKALEIAAPRDYLRRFIRRGEGIAELLRERHAQTPEPAFDRFVSRILAAFEDSARRRAEKLGSLRSESGARSAACVEALSPRELEVLRLLGEGLTAEEIALRSFVAPSTVQSHVKSIYAKLGVHRRVEALKRAGELGFL